MTTITFWLKANLREGWFLSRCGLLAGVVGAISVYEFRPSTPLDEAAVFLFVPLCVFYLFVRVLATVFSYAPDDKAVGGSGVRARLVGGCLGVAFAAIAIGLPSLLVYNLLDIPWASSFALRALAIAVGGLTLSAILFARRITLGMPVIYRFISYVAIHETRKIAAS